MVYEFGFQSGLIFMHGAWPLPKDKYFVSCHCVSLLNIYYVLHVLHKTAYPQSYLSAYWYVISDCLWDWNTKLYQVSDAPDDVFWTFIVKFDENSTIISPEGMNVLGPFSVGDFGNDNLSISRQVLSDWFSDR